MNPQLLTASQPLDPRPPVNEAIRKWLVKVTGIALPELVHNAEPPSPIEGLHYGALGDHRWHELSTISHETVLFPSRQGIYPPTREAILKIETASPEPLIVEQQADDAFTGHAIRQTLSAGRPCQYHRLVPERFQTMRLNLGNVAAEAICGIKETILMAESPWTKMSLKPTFKTMRWEQFLVLGMHPGAFVWTEIPHVGETPRPLLLEYIDDSIQGYKKALGFTPILSSGAKKWGERIFCFQPFACRMHISQGCEFRWQLVGFHLVFLLVWDNLDSATKEAKKYREQAVKAGEWSRCIYSSEEAWKAGAKPVSKWYKVTASPGDLLFLPPGALLMEHSSGAAVAMQGDFLPWACVPLLGRFSPAPDVYTLKCMLLRADLDCRAGRAHQSEITALLRLLEGKILRLPNIPTNERRGFQQAIDRFEAELEPIRTKYWEPSM